jgi:hypothetical protein
MTRSSARQQKRGAAMSVPSQAPLVLASIGAPDRAPHRQRDFGPYGSEGRSGPAKMREQPNCRTLADASCWCAPPSLRAATCTQGMNLCYLRPPRKNDKTGQSSPSAFSKWQAAGWMSRSAPIMALLCNAPTSECADLWAVRASPRNWSTSGHTGPSKVEVRSG